MSEEIKEKEFSDPKRIIRKNIRAGLVPAREQTKKDTHENSKDLKDAAWKAAEEIINIIGNRFFKFPPVKRYEIFSPPFIALWGLYIEYVKTFQNTFRIAEEGYYRCAFGELRDQLEIIMKMRYFYENIEDFEKWYRDPNKIFTTKDLRKKDFFKKSGLCDEIESFSNTLSIYRHGSSATLDSKGPLATNACYYRKDIYDKWCKHFIILKKLCIKILEI